MYPSGGQHFSVDFLDVVEELADAFEGDGFQLITMNQNQNIVIALSVALLALLYTFDPNIGTYSDPARYYLLGQSISMGTGLTSIWDAKAPPDTISSPGFPILIALLSMISGGSILLIKVVNGLFFLALTVLGYRLMIRLGMDHIVVLPSILLLTFNLHLVKHASLMMTELPYLFLATLSLFLLVRSEHQENDVIDMNFILGIVFAIASFYFRSVGATLLFAVFFNELWHKRWRRLLISVGLPLLAISPWILRSINLEGITNTELFTSAETAYPQLIPAGFIDYTIRLYKNIWYINSVGLIKGFLPFLSSAAEWHVIVGVLLGTTVGGFAIIGRKGIAHFRVLIFGYVLLNIGLILAVPYIFMLSRLFIPVLPFIAVMFVNGVHHLVHKLPTPLLSRGVYLLVIGIIITGSAINTSRLREELSKPLPPGFVRYHKAAKWARDNLPVYANMGTMFGERFFLYGGRVTSSLPITDDPYFFTQLLSMQGVTHVFKDEIVWSLSSGYSIGSAVALEPAIEKYPTAFEEVFRSDEGNTSIYRFIPDSVQKLIEGYETEIKR